MRSGSWSKKTKAADDICEESREYLLLTWLWLLLSWLVWGIVKGTASSVSVGAVLEIGGDV